MHHNDTQYWRYLQSLSPGNPDLPAPRVCRLLLRTFERWKGRPGWLTEQQVGHLFRNRTDLDTRQREDLASKPIVIRKALAIQRMLELILDPSIAASSGSSRVLADELIIGTLPPFSVGQGKEFVRYLSEKEELEGALNFLNELSPMGHIVPDHGVVLSQGLSAMASDARRRVREETMELREAYFLEAVAISLEAVIAYAARHAEIARAVANRLPAGADERVALESAAACLDVAPNQPARTFHEALQAIYIVHCALHWTVEIVPLGRLDQLLKPYYQIGIANGSLTPALAQELIDCFWIKLDEHAILNPRHAENRFTAADGVLTGYFGASNFDQGGLLNQWMQQITIGGLLPTDDECGTDACNDVTRQCLNAARRLPLNSPTLDLRVHRDTPDDVLQLAAQALLSGGAHPVLLNDDIIVPALAHASYNSIALSKARDYACDGCYETMIAGQSEFSFGFISALDIIEKTLNRGAGLNAAGPVNLRGQKDSWRSKPAAEIDDFEEFCHIAREHLLLQCHRYLRNLALFYGNKTQVCPSPLLSALIGGCVESKRDLTEGGARFHIFSPLLIAVSSAADSLYVIEHMAFGDDRAFSLSELTTCLATDWGNRVIERDGQKMPAFGPYVQPSRIREIRELCMQQPKFGSGVEGVDRHAWWLLETFVSSIQEAFNQPIHKTAFAELNAKYGTRDKPFLVNLAPGVGTFEQYIGMGAFSGASADGRRAGGSIASDLSPAPIPMDCPVTVGEVGRPVHARQYDIFQSLKSFNNPVMGKLGDGAPVDYNIREDYPVADLAKLIRSFADGKGGSICTFTAANPETFLAAQQDPEHHNLVRVRMGGWSEFFVALFPDHQEQHKRRPLYV